MKKIAALLATTACLFAAPPSIAYDASQLVQLLGSNACVDCDLTGVDLTNVSLVAADLAGADLKGALLNYADLAGADLTGADLTGAFVQNTNMTDAILVGALLTFVDLRYSNLTGADLTGALVEEFLGLSLSILCRTTMPDGAIKNRDC